MRIPAKRLPSISSDLGLYAIPLVKPGDYSLVGEAAGFKQYRQNGVRLETGSSARIDFTLEVGEVAESVTLKRRLRC